MNSLQNTRVTPAHKEIVSKPIPGETPQKQNEKRRRSGTSLERDSIRYAPIVIDDHAQLRVFAVSRAFFSKQPLILRISGMSPSEASLAGEYLNKNRRECGCSLGAKAMTAGFVIALAWLTIRYGVLTPGMFVRLPFAIAAAIAFAALGKSVGVAKARRRARREAARILTTFTY
jgi:hypothetical protein